MSLDDARVGDVIAPLPVRYDLFLEFIELPPTRKNPIYQ
jgi:hypothetical protein